MPAYEISIGQATYRVESDRELTDAEAYKYALQQHQATPEGMDSKKLAALRAKLATITDPREREAALRELDGFQAELERGTPPIAPAPAAPAPAAVDPELARMARDPRAHLPAEPAAPAAPAGLGNVPSEMDTGVGGPVAPAQQGSAPTAWRGTVGGIVGGLAGAAGGALLGGPVAAFLGSTAGSAIGTYTGTFRDALAEGKTEEEAADEALKAAGIDLAFSVGGGIVLKFGGKAFKFAVGSDPYKWIMDKLPKSYRLKQATPGEVVFDTTRPDQLQKAADKGARVLASPDAVPTPGQLTGQAGMLESAARTAKPGEFAAGELAQKRSLEAEIRTFREGLAGDAQHEFPGQALRSVLTQTEERVKEYTAPVWKRLAASIDINIVDASGMRNAARRLLDEELKSSFKTLDAEELKLIRRMAAGNAKISPAEAQRLQSRLFARADDLASSTSPNTNLYRMYVDFASQARSALDSALEAAVTSGRMAGEDLAQLKAVRALYKEMNERVYSPYLKAAHGATPDEKVAGAVVRPGDVSSIRALEALTDFAKKVDDLGRIVFKGAEGEPARQAVSGATDVVAQGAARRGLPALEDFSKPRDLSVFVRRAEAAAGGDQAAQEALRKSGQLVDDVQRPLADVSREALAGIRARFFEKYAGTPEALATLHQKMANPEFKQTFDALFPAADSGQRQAIERLSQAAQIWARRNVKGTTAGQQAMAADVGRRAIGPVMGTVSRAIAMFTPKWMAENYTKPGFSKFSAWVLGAASGNVGKVPEYVYEFIGQE